MAVTPARDEAGNLPRLAASLAAQSLPPSRWIVVDNGSTDGSQDIVRGFAREHPWAELLEIPPAVSIARGGPSARALNAGIAAIDPADPPGMVLNLDADVALPADFAARLAAALDADPRLGIVGGSCFEHDGTAWRQRHVTGDTVWGAARAFRWECLMEVAPVEERMSWDSLSQLKANALGWGTATLLDLPFEHHRPEGGRDGSRWRARATEGASAHYMWYRPWYLGMRATLHVARGEIGALGLVGGYAGAAWRREPRSPDPDIRAHVRSVQSPARVPSRIREALRRSRSADSADPQQHAGARR